MPSYPQDHRHPPHFTRTQILAPPPQLLAQGTRSPTQGVSSGTFSASPGQRREPTAPLVARVWVCLQPCQGRDTAARSPATPGPGGPAHAINLGTFPGDAAPLPWLTHSCHELGKVLSLLGYE